MSFLCDSIYFITVFLFGTVASVCFTGVPFNRKTYSLCLFSVPSTEYFRSFLSPSSDRRFPEGCIRSLYIFRWCFFSG